MRLAIMLRFDCVGVTMEPQYVKFLFANFLNMKSTMKRFLSIELLEKRDLFSIDGLLPDLAIAPDVLSSALGIHGGPRSEIEDDDESLEPLPPKSSGGLLKGSNQFYPSAGTNIQITNASLSDGFGAAQNILLVGQQIFLRAEWSSFDLPGGNYTVGFFFDGVRVDSANIAGATGSNSYWWYRAGSFASPGSHSFTIVVDPDNLIAESNEADNAISFDMSTTVPTNLPAKFIEPVGREANQFWAINNYADVNPTTGGSTDYRSGPYQYDGHDARDSGPWGFSSQDLGIPVYAAADGFVDAASDGYFDRETTFGNRPANYVQIDHGNGFKTLYYHFATNTVVVKPGQFVRAGELIAHMGSSGISTGTHLHYTPYYRGAPIETGYAPTVYNAAPLPYGGDVSKFFFETGISNNLQNSDINEHISNADRFAVGSSGTVSFWMQAYNLRAGDVLRWRYYRPNGTLLGTSTFSVPQDYRFSMWWWNLNLTTFSSVPGAWTVRFDISGVVEQSKTMTIDSAGAPAIRTTTSVGLINSGRTTPIDFGTTAVGGPSTQVSINIANHGTAPLTISNLRLPPGFALDSTAPAGVSVGGSVTLIVNLTSTDVGSKFGAISFDTNDPDTPKFWFNVSGKVTGSPPIGRPTITVVGPATPLYGINLPVTINREATVSIPVGENSPGFNGGQLKVEVANAPSVNDILGINRIGGNSGRIVDSIGTVSGGTKGNPLVITFNSNASVTSIQQLIRNITFASTHPKYIYARRYIRFTLTDSAGLMSNLAIAHIIPAAKPPLPRVFDATDSTKTNTTIARLADSHASPSFTNVAIQFAALESILAELERTKTSRLRK